MSTMAATKQGRRPRRQFDDDFRAQAVRLVLDEGKTLGQVSPAVFERRSATQAAAVGVAGGNSTLASISQA